MNTRFGLMIIGLLLLGAGVVLADGKAPKVVGILGMTPVETSSCIAVYVPIPEDQALAGIEWYNNDAAAVFPKVSLASGVPEQPVSLKATVTCAEMVEGLSSDWGGVTFSEPVGCSSEGLYILFQFPTGSEYESDGHGGGAGIGYIVGQGGYTGWLTIDGQEWIRLHEDFGIAVRPVLVAEDEGTMQIMKSQPASAVVVKTMLMPAVPNPFNPAAEIRFSLLNPGMVELAIYNVKGQLVKQLVSEPYAAGNFSVTWQGRDGSGRAVASGVYFTHFKGDGVSMTQRMTLVR